jgi:signal transduction histidine kinase
LLENFA